MEILKTANVCWCWVFFLCFFLRFSFYAGNMFGIRSIQGCSCQSVSRRNKLAVSVCLCVLMNWKNSKKFSLKLIHAEIKMFTIQIFCRNYRRLWEMLDEVSSQIQKFVFFRSLFLFLFDWGLYGWPLAICHDLRMAEISLFGFQKFIPLIQLESV